MYVPAVAQGIGFQITGPHCHPHCHPQVYHHCQVYSHTFQSVHHQRVQPMSTVAFHTPLSSTRETTAPCAYVVQEDHRAGHPVPPTFHFVGHVRGLWFRFQGTRETKLTRRPSVDHCSASPMMVGALMLRGTYGEDTERMTQLSVSAM
jgi:hypothetical protein